MRAAQGFSEDAELRGLLAGDMLGGDEVEGCADVRFPFLAGRAVLDLGALSGVWAHDAAPPLLSTAADDVASLCGLSCTSAVPGTFADAEPLDDAMHARGIDVILIVDITPGARMSDVTQVLTAAVDALGEDDRICLVDTDAPRRRSPLIRANSRGKALLAWLSGRVRGAVLGTGDATARAAGALSIAASVLDDRSSTNSATAVVMISVGPLTRPAASASASATLICTTQLLASAMLCSSRARLCCATLGFGDGLRVYSHDAGMVDCPHVSERRAMTTACGGLFQNLGHSSQLRAFLRDALALEKEGPEVEPSVPPAVAEVSPLWAALRVTYPAAPVFYAGLAPSDDSACTAAVARHATAARLDCIEVANRITTRRPGANDISYGRFRIAQGQTAKY
jgi:hypothetical protein